MRPPRIGIVCFAQRVDLARRVLSKRCRLVLSAAAQILRQGGKPRCRVIAIGRNGAIAARGTRPTPQIVIAICPEHTDTQGRIVLPDRGHVAGHVRVLVE